NAQYVRAPLYIEPADFPKPGAELTGYSREVMLRCSSMDAPLAASCHSAQENALEQVHRQRLRMQSRRACQHARRCEIQFCATQVGEHAACFAHDRRERGNVEDIHVGRSEE